MNAAHPIDVLNRLYSLHDRSLAMYLSYASPWARNGQSDALAVLRRIAADQKTLRDRCGEMIIEIDGAVRRGTFPLSFTSLHDLSFDYLLDKLIADQKRLGAGIELCATHLEYEPLARALAEEALGYARGHLDLLEEMKKPKLTLALADVANSSAHAGTIVGAPADPAAPAATHAPVHH